MQINIELVGKEKQRIANIIERILSETHHTLGYSIKVIPEDGNSYNSYRQLERNKESK